MNNYFGIGLDAKISLEFNNKRDEHPKKCRYVRPGRRPGRPKVFSPPGAIIWAGVGSTYATTVTPKLPPVSCSSRTKNMMWYGVLGTKELVQKTYKNLEQRVQLEVKQERGVTGGGGGL